jgi:EpsI family protein
MSRTTSRVLALLALALAAVAYAPILGFEPPVVEAEGPVESFFFQPADTSPQLVYGMAALFFLGRRRWMRAALDAGERGGLAPGLALTGLGAAVFVWSVHTAALDLRIVSLVPLLLGAALLVGGPRMLRAVLRPTLFLLFALPLPAVLVNQLVVPAQLWTAELARWMLLAIGIDAQQSGDLIFARDYTFQVIETCSGLRFLQTLTMAAVAYTEIFNRHRWHAAALILAAPLLAFLLNGVRVVTIVLSVGTLPAAEDHTIQGLVMIVIGVLLLQPIDFALQRWLPERFRRGRRELRVDPAQAHPAPAWRWATVLTVLAVLVGASWRVTPWTSPVGAPGWGVALPRAWGDYEAATMQVDANFLGSVRFTKRVQRAYERAGERVEIFVGYDDMTHRARSPFSPRLPYPGPGWELDESQPMALDGFPAPVTASLLHIGRRRALSYTWYEDARPPLAELVRAVTALDRSAARPPVGVTAVRLTTFVDPSADGLAAAHERLQRFAAELRPKLVEASTKISAAATAQRRGGSEPEAPAS